MDELVIQLRAMAGLRKMQGQPEIALLTQAADAIAHCRIRIVDECIAACDRERVNAIDGTDVAYNMAIEHCVKALTTLKRVYG